MILKKEIGEKAAVWGVTADIVDKDWVLGHILVAFMQTDNHEKKLVFKGGTCLRKCRFPDYRFSEDLDFTATDHNYKLTQALVKESIGYARNNSGILFHLEELSDLIYEDKLVGYQAKLKYWGANHSKNQIPPSPDRWMTKIKIEVTLYEMQIFSAEKQAMNHPYSDSNYFSGKKMPCYDLKEVIAEKIRSLVQRSYTAPRDVYDIWYLKDQFNEKDWAEIKRAFLAKMEFKGYTFKGIDQLINEKSINILKRSWKESLDYQLPSGTLPDVDLVIREITELFIKYLT